MNHNASTGLDPHAVEMWLRTLHARHDGTGHFTVSWTTSGGRIASRHFTITDGIDQAVEHIRQIDQARPAGIYARVTSTAEIPERRGGAGLSYTLPALWADIDIAGPGHKHDDTKPGVLPLPGDEQQGRAIVTEAGLPEPTIWIHSGGGLYPIWVIDPVPVIAGHLDQAKALARGWQTVLGKAAERLGLHYGTEVSDLARVLRIPGTVNRKDEPGWPCRFLSSGGPTYTSRQLRDALVAVQPEPEPRPEPGPQQDGQTPPRDGGFDWNSVWNDDGVKPGDDFNEHATAEIVIEMLTEAGWSIDHEDSRKIYLRRPGKTDPGHSATVDRTTRGLWVFSGDAHPFRAHTEGIDKGERPFSVYAILHHGGNYTAAARALSRAGFGRRSTPTGSSRRDQPDDPEDGQPEPAPADEKTGGDLPSPNQPLAVARRLVARMRVPRLWWRGDFYQWQGTRWDATETSFIEHWIYRQTEHAEYEFVDAKGEASMRAWAPNKKRVADVAHALGVGALQRFGDDDKVTATTNGILEIGPAGRTLLPHTPERFNLFSLPFAYDADAECPFWLAFLESILPGDQQAHDFLGEWFGYVLSGRTDQQKILALIGERRSGKGTIARVLAAMLGKENIAGLDLNLLPGNFGLESLIGKSLAISGDVRWHSRSVGDAVPILLQVSGQDNVTAHRKNRSSWSGELGVRFMLMSNDTPTFSDRSGALSGRMIYVKFAQSFYGREDVSLTDKLLHELPGILNWALDGLERLNGRGRFTEPISGQAEAEAARRLSDPIGAFLEDWCVIDPGRDISLDLLFTRYRHWCESEGRTKDSTTKEIFSRDLRSKVPALTVKRERVGGKQVRNLYGIGCDVTNGFDPGPRPF
jgi:putative DNA primase/helicase